jgi:hypothetical protein
VSVGAFDLSMQMVIQNATLSGEASARDNGTSTEIAVATVNAARSYAVGLDSPPVLTTTVPANMAGLVVQNALRIKGLDETEVQEQVDIAKSYINLHAFSCQTTYWSEWGMCGPGCGSSQTANTTRKRAIIHDHSKTTCPHLNETKECFVPECGIETTVSSAVTDEDGKEVSILLRLKSIPREQVLFTVSCLDSTEATVAPNVLALGPSSLAAEVIVTGVFDGIEDGNQPYRVVIEQLITEDPDYKSLSTNNATISLTNNDAAVNQLKIVGTESASCVTSESGVRSINYTVGTENWFDGNDITPGYQYVTVVLRSKDITEGRIRCPGADAGPEGQVVLKNKDATASCVIEGVDDNLADGDVTYTVEVSAVIKLTNGLTKALASADKLPPAVSCVNEDNDVPGIRKFSKGCPLLATSESGSSCALGVEFDTVPSHPVYLNVTISDPTEGALAFPTKLWQPSEWPKPALAVIKGVDDMEVDTTSYEVTGLLTSEDSDYNSLSFSFTLQNDDNDAPLLVVQQNGTNLDGLGMPVDETGLSTTFTVKLSPSFNLTAPVMLLISSSDTTEVVVDKAELNFTAATAGIAQTVTVKGVDDLEADGVKEVTISLRAVSEDVKFANVSWNYRLLNYDDDQLQFTESACHVYEGSNNSCASTLRMNELPDLPSLSSISLSLDYSACTSLGVLVSPTSIPPLGGDTTAVDFAFKASEDNIDNPDRCNLRVKSVLNYRHNLSSPIRQKELANPQVVIHYHDDDVAGVEIQRRPAVGPYYTHESDHNYLKRIVEYEVCLRVVYPFLK